jgi:hypothetical protein
MKYFRSVLAATAALGLASLAWGAGPEDQSATGPQSQAMSPQQAMPQQTDPPAATGASPETGPPSSHLAALVPAGMTTQEACTGFKSVKDCAAALHASQNLSIPFEDLKGKMTGGQRLGAAIHTLKPEANARTEAKRAEGQAEGDVHGSPPRG